MTTEEMLFLAEREAKARTLFAQAITINSISEYYEAGISYMGNSQWVDVFIYRKCDPGSDAVLFETFRLNMVDEESEQKIDDAFAKLLNNEPL